MEAEMTKIRVEMTTTTRDKAKGGQRKAASLQDILLDTMAAGADAVELCVPVEKPAVMPAATPKKEESDGE
jgi:hypothetical protein